MSTGDTFVEGAREGAVATGECPLLESGVALVPVLHAVTTSRTAVVTPAQAASRLPTANPPSSTTAPPPNPLKDRLVSSDLNYVYTPTPYSLQKVYGLDRTKFTHSAERQGLTGIGFSRWVSHQRLPDSGERCNDEHVTSQPEDHDTSATWTDAVTELPIVLACAALGAVVGAAATPVTRRLLTERDHHRLASAPVLAAATAIVFGLLAWRIGIHPDLAAYCCLAAAGIPLAAIDLIEHRLPWPLLAPLYPVLVGLFGLSALLGHDPARLLRAMLGMVALLAFYLLIALLSRGGLGAGDVRLAGVLGLALAWHGWTALVFGTVLGLLCAAVAGAILVTVRRATRRTPIPFGPALIAGAVIALLVPLG